MKKLFTKCVVVLGFVFFFALFSANFVTVTAHAKEVTKTELVGSETQAEIKLGVKTKSLVKDTNYTLKVYNLSENQKAVFKSGEPEIATVNEDGVIYGISNGVTAITVTIKEGAKTITTLSCEVTVGPPAINVKWTKSKLILPVGKRSTLKTILLPFNTVESAKFFSSDTDIVTVNNIGKITAKAEGTAYVFTAIDNGKYDFCQIIVVEEEVYNQLMENPDALDDYEAKPSDTEGTSTTVDTETEEK